MKIALFPVGLTTFQFNAANAVLYSVYIGLLDMFILCK